MTSGPYSSSVCQVCYNYTRYVELWGSEARRDNLSHGVLIKGDVTHSCGTYWHMKKMQPLANHAFNPFEIFWMWIVAASNIHIRSD